MEPRVVAGVVLAGGRSSRMGGQDKCLAPLAGRPVVAHVIARLEPQVATLALNANAEPSRLASFGLPIIADRIAGHAGPLAGLHAALETGDCNLEAVLAAFVEPALALAQDRHGGGAFIRVIARAYAEKNDSLRRFLSDQYGHVLREFAKAIAGCVPSLSKETLYWRLDFLSGALTYAMADFGMIKRRTGSSEAAHRERAARELIAFAAAGRTADTN